MVHIGRVSLFSALIKLRMYDMENLYLQTLRIYLR